MEQTSPAPPAPPATRGARFGAFFLASLLSFLWIWLLAFLLEDVGRMNPVDYDEVYAAGMPSELIAELRGVNHEVGLLELRIKRQEQIQGVLQRDVESSGKVMEQMMNLQRLALEKGSVPSVVEREALAMAQETFLSSQGKYREANIEIQSANRTLFELQQKRTELETRKGSAEAPIQKEFRARQRARALIEASVRLGILIPLFLVAAATVRRRWRHPWRPIYLSFLVATFWTLGYEMFEQFPAEYFKYIAIVTAIGIVIAFLAWIIRKSTSPSPSLVLARNRAALHGERLSGLRVQAESDTDPGDARREATGPSAAGARRPAGSGGPCGLQLPELRHRALRGLWRVLRAAPLAAPLLRGVWRRVRRGARGPGGGRSDLSEAALGR